MVLLQLGHKNYKTGIVPLHVVRYVDNGDESVPDVSIVILKIHTNNKN